MSAPHLFQCLTQDEWRLCFAVAFLVEEQFTDDYRIGRYATPGTEGVEDWSWEEMFRRAVRYLALEHGMEFEGLDVYADGRILAGGAICEPNIVYVRMLQQGSLPPNLEGCFEVAIELSEVRASSLPREPLRAALDKVRRDCAWIDAHTDPDAVQETFDLRDAALAEIGIRRLPPNGKPTIH